MVGSSAPPLVLALATDAGFAMPTAVAVRSALDTVGPERDVEVVVIGTGLDEPTWERLAASWDRPRTVIHRIDGDADRFSTLPESKYITRATYQRYNLPDILADRDRVLYIDGDVLVRADVSPLFDIDLEGASTGGVRDYLWWYLGDETAGAMPGLADLGFDPTDPYVNCGVLLMSLDRWREEHVAARAIAYLEASENVRELDQDGINVAVHGRWLLLDPRWNAQTAAWWPGWPRGRAEGEPATPFPPTVVRDVRRDPWIVHFTTKEKPWSQLCRHPFQGEWLRVHQRTAWADEPLDVASPPRRLVRRARRRLSDVVERARSRRVA